MRRSEATAVAKRRPKGRQGKSFAFWLPPSTEARLDWFIKNTSPPPSKKAVILTALEAFFDHRGVPKEPAPGDDD